MKVDRIYTRNAIGISRRETLEEAAAAMRRFHVGSLLVFEKTGPRAELVGIVTDRDLVVLSVAEGRDARTARVEEVMSPVVASVSEDADILEALERMRGAGVRRLVVTTERGEPVGVVAIDDIVDGLAAELASASALMKAGIRREVSEFAESRAAD